jgi:hypothetical protein
VAFTNQYHVDFIYESNPTAIRPPPPGNLTFEKIIGQMPAQTGRNHSQMPCYRGSPGSGILAIIKLNKYFKIKKNEKYARQFFLFNRAYCIIYL